MQITTARSRPIRSTGVLASTLLVLSACGGRSHTPPADLLAAANTLYASDNSFFGRRHLTELSRLRAATDPHDALRIADLDVRMQAIELRLGQVDDAVGHLEEALRSARTVERLGPRIADLEFWRGIAWLRKAEVVNCIGRHGASCCIWPFEGEGLHIDASPASTALDAFLACLDRRPSDLGARWLAHVAAAACRATDRIPKELSIPLPAPSGSRVGRFVDRAPDLSVAAFDLCGGAVVVDVDCDGFLDLVSTSWEPTTPMKLFRARGDGSFEDRSEESGLSAQVGGLNCMAVDYDGDGDDDLFVLRGAWLMDQGRIRNSLLRNDGRGHFTDVTHLAGLATPAYPTQTAAWADFDGDGDLDVYVGNESRRELRDPPGGDHPSQLFVNRGDGTFEDFAARAGVTNDRYCKGVAAGDYDDDGDIDLYVSNVGRNRLYRNDGNLRFTDVAESLGVTEPDKRSFACWFFDYDNDGRLDLFVAGYDATLSDVAGDLIRAGGGAAESGGETPRLFHNLGGRFEDVTRATGLDRVCLPMGANFGDIDSDGYLDIYLGTGAPEFEMLVPNLMLRNDGGRRFVDVTTAAGLGHLQKGHGVAFADLDQDGDSDLFLQLGGFYPGDAYFNALFENPGNGNHFVVLELSGSGPNPSAFGARIRVDVDGPDGPRSMHRAVGSVSSFGGSSFRQEIGLGTATTIRSVTVRWPSGEVSKLVDVAPDTFVRITEGHPESVAIIRPKMTLRAHH